MNRMHAMCVVGLACCFAALGGCDGVAGSQGRLERAEKAIAAGDYGAAMVDIRNALDKAPNDARALQSLASLKPSFVEMGQMGGYDAVATQRYPEVEEVNHVHHAGNSSARGNSTG